MGQLAEQVRLVDDLRELAALEEVLHRAVDGLVVEQVARRERLGEVLGLQVAGELLLHGAAQLEHGGAQLVAEQVGDRAHAAVAEVVDVVGLAGGAVGADQGEQVVERAQVVVDRQDAALGRALELAVDAEAADRAEVVALLVQEAVLEELAHLLLVGGVARAQAAVDAQQRLVVARRLVLAQGVEQDVVGLGAGDDQLDVLDAEALEVLEAVLAELLAGLGERFARLLVEDVVGEDAADGLLLGALAAERDGVGLEEVPDDRGGGAEILVQRAQEAGRDDLGALVDLDLEDVLGGLLDLDPGAALRNDAAGVVAAARGAGLAREVDAGRALDLGDDRALGAVDDELAAADADREVADVDVLFEHVLEGRVVLAADADLQLQPALVGEAQVAALVHVVLRRGEQVAVVADHHLVIVAGDREELLEDGLQALDLVPHIGGRLGVEEVVVALRLEIHQAGDGDDFLGVAEGADLHGTSRRAYSWTAQPLTRSIRVSAARIRRFPDGSRSAAMAAVTAHGEAERGWDVSEFRA